MSRRPSIVGGEDAFPAMEEVSMESNGPCAGFGDDKTAFFCAAFEGDEKAKAKHTSNPSEATMKTAAVRAPVIVYGGDSGESPANCPHVDGEGAHFTECGLPFVLSEVPRAQLRATKQPVHNTCDESNSALLNGDALCANEVSCRSVKSQQKTEAPKTASPPQSHPDDSFVEVNTELKPVTMRNECVSLLERAAVSPAQRKSPDSYHSTEAFVSEVSVDRTAGVAAAHNPVCTDATARTQGWKLSRHSSTEGQGEAGAWETATVSGVSVSEVTYVASASRASLSAARSYSYQDRKEYRRSIDRGGRGRDRESSRHVGYGDRSAWRHSSATRRSSSADYRHSRRERHRESGRSSGSGRGRRDRSASRDRHSGADHGGKHKRRRVDSPTRRTRSRRDRDRDASRSREPLRDEYDRHGKGHGHAKEVWAAHEARHGGSRREDRRAGGGRDESHERAAGEGWVRSERGASPDPSALSLSAQSGTTMSAPAFASSSRHHHSSSGRGHRHSQQRARRLRDLPLEWWERAEDCKAAKAAHTARIDHMCGSREELVLKTTLWEEDTVLEPNMFPYWTPRGVEHYTLWSVHDLDHHQIVAFVDAWLTKRMPQVRRWQYDDNAGERSIDLFHVHVFIETAPFSFTPREGFEYFPPHCNDHPILL